MTFSLPCAVIGGKEDSPLRSDVDKPEP